MAEGGLAAGGKFAKIGERSIGILNLHAGRNVLNAASTSASVATPLRSASSIAVSSSAVAGYSPERRASISRAASSSSATSSSGQEATRSSSFLVLGLIGEIYHIGEDYQGRCSRHFSPPLRFWCAMSRYVHLEKSWCGRT